MEDLKDIIVWLLLIPLASVISTIIIKYLTDKLTMGKNNSRSKKRS